MTPALFSARLQAVARHLAVSASSGTSSVSRDDTFDLDGAERLVAQTIETLVHSGWRKRSDLTADDAAALEALETLSEAWGAGYDLASLEDHVDDERTVGAVLCRYVDGPSLTPSTPALR